ncbi:MAG: polyprenyl synthetase family protein [Lachnospiraceae bacterium]|nr:polyprenyl synthetase family protein [Lachnospiraceae bacterium]
MDFNESLELKRKNAESILNDYLPEADGYQSMVLDAMSYSAMAGGKRLRPVLMKECYKLFGGKDKLIEPFMAAIEMIHNYSLVHDDLPAMDNDEFRRGKETTWKKYDEAIAILAGDGLLNYAFETASGAFELAKDEEDYKRIAKAISILSRKAGVYGMIGGQTADILAEDNDNVTKELLIFIHKNKTAALMEASMMIGAVLAGASEKDVLDMEKAASNIGIAFQIQDDILDVTGNEQELGKPVHSDEKNSKKTYVTLHGLSESSEEVKRLSTEAIDMIREMADENRADASFLMTLVETLINRRK